MNVNYQLFKKIFPNLAKETSKCENRFQEVVTSNSDQITKLSAKFKHYNPNVVDFLRCCSRDEEALEIINYLEKQNELTTFKDEELRNQLKEKGMGIFGSKKCDDYYQKESLVR